ncbi:MAG: hypothetical protein OEZ06_14210 [Myxococcales bacterium]|nr:hypothetical protein [Myxococcales bacterium]
MKFFGVSTACLLCLLSASALAQEPVEDDEFLPFENPLEERAIAGITLGGKVGGGIGGPFNEFGASFVGEVELGYLLPLGDSIGHSLGIFASGQYSQPQTNGENAAPDPRLPGDGIMEYKLTQQEVALTLGLIYRLPLSTDLLMPYLAAGGRYYMMRTTVEASVGDEPFGKNEETFADFGGYAALGADFFLGPGAILAELQFATASVEQYVLRDTNVGTLNLAVGYRLIL